MAALIVIYGDSRGQFFNLPKAGSLVLGRDSSLIAHIDDPALSWNHAEIIHHEDGTAHILDLKSHNGVALNGHRLRHATTIKDGDIVEMGYNLLVFVNKDLDETSPIEPFLKACERLYPEHLQKMRDHEARHAGEGGKKPDKRKRWRLSAG